MDNLFSEDDLSDEQIYVLLQRAKSRLQEKCTITTREKGSVKNLPNLPKLDVGTLPPPYVRSIGEIAYADPARLLRKEDRDLSNRIRKVEDPLVVKKQLAEEKKATAGPSWFNLPRTNLTPELKRDLQLLKMRGVLDPHRHYKKESGKAKAPEYSQVGTIIEGRTEFFSARIQNRDRKKTFADEIMAGEEQSGRFKRDYERIQTAKTSGKKAHYKKLQEKRASKVHKR